MKIVIANELDILNLQRTLIDNIKNIDVLHSLQIDDWSNVDICLIIVPYKDNLSVQLHKTIESYLKNDNRASIVPVCLSEVFTNPPAPIARITAIHYPSQDENNSLLKRIRCHLVLKQLCPTRHIFISYRTNDGSKIAAHLKKILNNDLDFKSTIDIDWREYEDKNRKYPSKTNKNTIEKHIRNSSFFFIICTPDSISSKWVKYELKMANKTFIPVLPIYISNINSSDRQLSFLSFTERKFAVANVDEFTCNSEQLKTKTIEYLSDIYTRKNLVLPRVERAFIRNNYTWQAKDVGKRMYQSEDKITGKPKVLSHCSVSDIDYRYSIGEFVRQIDTFGVLINWNFFIHNDINKNMAIYKKELHKHNNLKIYHVDELNVVLELLR